MSQMANLQRAVIDRAYRLAEIAVTLALSYHFDWIDPQGLPRRSEQRDDSD